MQSTCVQTSGAGGERRGAPDLDVTSLSRRSRPRRGDLWGRPWGLCCDPSQWTQLPCRRKLSGVGEGPGEGWRPETQGQTQGERGREVHIWASRYRQRKGADQERRTAERRGGDVFPAPRTKRWFLREHAGRRQPCSLPQRNQAAPGPSLSRAPASQRPSACIPPVCTQCMHVRVCMCVHSPAWGNNQQRMGGES